MTKSDDFDLFDAADARASRRETQDNAPELSVSELSGAIKRALEDGFGRVRVRGEIGRVSRPRSGHVYLDLKDSSAVLSAVIWKGVAARLELQPTEGDEVVAEGRITTFGGQSKYQLVIDRLSHAGEGALLAKLQKLKQALEAEGLFAEARKRAPPTPPDVLGVITSPSGAVIRDILHRIEERWPLRVIVWPVAVQGASCAPEVAAAIRGFNALPEGGPIPRPDAIIVARGGGSIEDLWGFNDERVVRAAAESAIPLISAVGHETDWTLIDLAADRRAPTPTAAAEMLTPVRRDLAAALAGLEQRRLAALSRIMAEKARRLSDTARLMGAPERLLEAPEQRLDRAEQRLGAALGELAATKRLDLARRGGRLAPHLLGAAADKRRAALNAFSARLDPGLARMTARPRLRLTELSAGLNARALRTSTTQAGRRLEDAARRLHRAQTRDLAGWTARRDQLSALLESLSYRATLARGFAVVRDADGGRMVKTAAEAPGDIVIEFSDSRKTARITGDDA